MEQGCPRQSSGDEEKEERFFSFPQFIGTPKFIWSHLSKVTCVSWLTPVNRGLLRQAALKIFV